MKLPISKEQLEFARRVLEGEKVRAVNEDYGYERRDAYRIVIQACKRTDPMRFAYYKLNSINALRADRAYFLSRFREFMGAYYGDKT